MVSLFGSAAFQDDQLGELRRDLGRCYQVMECDDSALLHRWMERWADLCEFEVIPVITSAEAQAAVAPRLDR